MLLFGHRFIKSEALYHISDIDSIIHTPPSSVIYIEFDEKNIDILQHLEINSIRFATEVQNIKELIYASSLGATYAVVSKHIAKSLQNIAESYLLDIKILTKIEDEDEIEEIAKLGIDGAIFPSAIIKVTP
jgi:homospermidine synthase